jgi:hypothetical protein
VETGAICTAAPARQSGSRRKYPSKERKAGFWRAFAIRRRSLNSQIGEFAGCFGKSLRLLPRIFPFSGDFHWRPGSISTACGMQQSHSRFSLIPTEPRGRTPVLNCRLRAAVRGGRSETIAPSIASRLDGSILEAIAKRPSPLRYWDPLAITQRSIQLIATSHAAIWIDASEHVGAQDVSLIEIEPDRTLYCC